MRTKKPIVITLFLCTWSIVSYILLIRQSGTSSWPSIGSNSQHNNDLISNEILQKLQHLEENIKEESKLHDELMAKLVYLIRLNDDQLKQKTAIVELVQTKSAIPADAVPVVGYVERINNEINNIDESNNNIESINGAFDTNKLIPDKQYTVSNRLKALTKPNLKNINFHGPVIPVLVFACNRVSVRNCLDNLIQYRPNADQFPIIVSQVS